VLTIYDHCLTNFVLIKTPHQSRRTRVTPGVIDSQQGLLRMRLSQRREKLEEKAKARGLDNGALYLCL
jgi:hypothetical protein